ncbi:hypothetical protein JCM10908_007150 [Rhodotorula pacifica]|uniref:uncharacterized protein n=1 Tax=Rhodotorula pacifica TaxID=1495444 RepID=UPI00317C3F1F
MDTATVANSAPPPDQHHFDSSSLVGIDLLRAAAAYPPQPPQQQQPAHTLVTISTPSSSTATSRAASPALQPLPPDRPLPKPRRPPSVSLQQNGAPTSIEELADPESTTGARPPPAPRLNHSPNPNLYSSSSQRKRQQHLRGTSTGTFPYSSSSTVDAYLSTFRTYTRALLRPRTYLHFLRSLHPSLIALFLVSVSATLSNKTLLRGFFQGLTYSLTTWQLACASLGTMLAERIGVYRPQRVPTKHGRLVQAVAFVFSCEILCSNLALRLVPVPFHVSLRAASPFLTLVLSVLFFGEHTTLTTTSTLLVVLFGVALTSHHEAWLSLGSLLLSASALLLTAKSLLVSHVLESRLHLAPLDILARLSPLSMTHCAVFAVLNSEPRKLWSFIRGEECTRAHVAQVALNGVLSFGVVVLGLVAEKRTRPPALAITAHAAQASTILFSLVLFGLRLSFLNCIGVALTLTGGVLYARWDAQDKKDRLGLTGSVVGLDDGAVENGGGKNGGGLAYDGNGNGVGGGELPMPFSTAHRPPRDKVAPD